MQIRGRLYSIISRDFTKQPTSDKILASSEGNSEKPKLGIAIAKLCSPHFCTTSTAVRPASCFKYTQSWTRPRRVSSYLVAILLMYSADASRCLCTILLLSVLFGLAGLLPG